MKFRIIVFFQIKIRPIGVLPFSSILWGSESPVWTISIIILISRLLCCLMHVVILMPRFFDPFEEGRSEYPVDRPYLLMKITLMKVQGGTGVGHGDQMGREAGALMIGHLRGKKHISFYIKMCSALSLMYYPYLIRSRFRSAGATLQSADSLSLLRISDNPWTGDRLSGAKPFLRQSTCHLTHEFRYLDYPLICTFESTWPPAEGRKEDKPKTPEKLCDSFRHFRYIGLFRHYRRVEMRWSRTLGKEYISKAPTLRP